MHNEKYTNVYIQNQGTTQIYSKPLTFPYSRCLKIFNENLIIYFLVIFMNFFY